MECPDCNKFIRCIDSRKKLSYSPDIRKGEKVPVRERKYACTKCDMIYITREYLFKGYHPVNNIKDKRIVKKRKKK